jgi:ketosteroid isomerase-like protein
MTELLSSEYICSFIERHYAGCNAADAAKMMSCFTDDAVHYFPPGTYSASWRNEKTIVNK